MNSLVLASTGKQTSQLGFGGSSIMGALNRRQSLGMLEAAFDAGIRHFDTAPLYGFGEAESCLGEFLRRHPGQCTVTTKFGLCAAPSPPHIRLARAIARPILQRFPALKQRAARAAAAAPPPAAAPEPAHTFSVAEARASLDQSLRALGTDHIDVWLLHEVTAAALHDEELLRLLQDAVSSGRIGTFGVGSGGDKIPDLVRDAPAYCPVLQYEWSVFDAVPSTPGSFRIHHRALATSFRTLRDLLGTDAARAQRWSEHVGSDLRDPEQLATLMVRAALAQNPGSIILFSSKNPEHIRHNVALAGDTALVPPALRLFELVQAERASLPTPA